jgi:sulfonate transport system ATP-binding protein
MAGFEARAIDAAAMTQTPIAAAAVRIRGLTRAFGGPRVLDELDLDLTAGSFTALLGPSGSGKSTLLRTLAGLDTAPEGVVQVPDRRAVVFQEPRLLPWKRVWRNVALGLRVPEAQKRAQEALGELGLSHRLDAWPMTLSGGEAQRVALARALVRDPKLMLLDEPFAALDALTRLRMQALVSELWQSRRLTVLLVTHDVDEALLLADRAVVLRDGRIGADVAIPLGRPRHHGDRAFIRLRQRLLSELGVDETGAERH